MVHFTLRDRPLFLTSFLLTWWTQMAKTALHTVTTSFRMIEGTWFTSARVVTYRSQCRHFWRSKLRLREGFSK